MHLLPKYFPQLSPHQTEQFYRLISGYTEWNARINVVSRKDIDSLEERHILHSLSIAKAIQFKPGTRILDIGTGGGLPGIPLAILFPETQFVLVDSIGKKIRVVHELTQLLQLKNVTAFQERAEKVQGKFDFIVSRAVAPTPKIVSWTKKHFLSKSNHSLKNGYLLLKGGDLTEELSAYKSQVQEIHINMYFKETFFETKKIIYLPKQP